MFRFLLMATMVAPPSVATSAPLDLLVGSYTGDGGPGIYVFRFDPASGRLEQRPWQTVQLHNPSWLVLAPDRRHVYAVNENGPEQPDPVGRVSRLRLDPATHRLELDGQVPSLGDEPTHASLSPDGRYLFVANYAVNADPGGTLAVVPVAADGSLRPPTQLSSYQASGVDRERQASAHVHSATMAPDGRHLLVADLGGDRVYAYRYDPQASAERPLRPAPEPFVALPPGSGPRHLVFDATGRHAYLTLEMSGQVAVLDYADGRLAVREVLDLFAPGFSGDNGAGAIHLSADGRFLYAVNRGSDNHIVVFAVDPHDGGLRQLQRRAAGGRQPREFAIAPGGRFVLVAAQGDDRITVIERDDRTGLLGRSVQQVEVAAPSDLKFLP
ncbi:lactonase family protein [Stenotrophomonas sp. MMGLT7]|uniref:lactonase family protein n=1 Tax=Stenotrophomonas sp. MMGLT7 TaxID=2901227 RepID=UPI001E3799E5|nr:lactonase family protein [Stenotrophomonas sp. MMGLT7]MCD7097947.1 lactonase family protein [Stenotrophomonas sp. MMGLT7]